MASSGTVTVRKIELAGRDIYDAFTSCSIYEDIFQNTWSGHIDIMETEFIRETIPIIGEEIIIIQFSSRKPFAGTNDETIQFIGRVTKLKDYREGTATQRRYRLHFQSIWAEVSKGQRCRKHYRGTPTEVASAILQAQVGTKFQTLDPAKFTRDFVFPNMNPYQCINFLSTVATSKRYADPYYLFYEDRDGFHMTTLSQIMDKPKVDTVKVKLVQQTYGEKGAEADKTLTSVISFDPLFDTLENSEMGLYGGTLISYDKVNKVFKEQRQTYSDTYDRYKHVSDKKLTISRAESPKNKFQFIMENDNTSPGIYSELEAWALPRPIRAAQIRGHRAHLYLNRSTGFKVGDILDWELMAGPPGGQAPDKVLGKNWMITRIHHKFNHVNYNAHVEIIKDGRG